MNWYDLDIPLFHGVFIDIVVFAHKLASSISLGDIIKTLLSIFFIFLSLCFWDKLIF